MGWAGLGWVGFYGEKCPWELEDGGRQADQLRTGFTSRKPTKRHHAAQTKEPQSGLQQQNLPATCNQSSALQPEHPISSRLVTLSLPTSPSRTHIPPGASLSGEPPPRTPSEFDQINTTMHSRLLALGDTTRLAPRHQSTNLLLLFQLNLLLCINCTFFDA
jgi:hypothetical protein